MRIIAGLVGLIGVVAGVGLLMAGVVEPLYRPQARVSADPAAYYSPALFSPMPKPDVGDWMAAHPEPAQSFEQFVASYPVRPTKDRHTLYLSQVGAMKEVDTKRLETLREFLEVFYTLPTRLGPAVTLDKVTHRDRTMSELKYRQYLTADLLDKILPPILPKDAVCLQGVTMEDLYPDPSWNYVFGQASLSDRVGIYSLVRFYPAFWGLDDGPEAQKLGLRRSLKTLVHETGHMFGVNHCQKYECLMNGSNNLPEADRQPIHLCPDCLKKFRWNIGFDVVERYEALKKFYTAHDMAAEAEWVDKRIKECGGPKAGAKS
jgi:archaemetzincin